MRTLSAVMLYVSLSFVPGSVRLFAGDLTQSARAARAALHSGDYATAERRLRDAVAESPDPETEPARAARIALADVLHEQGRDQEARPLYEALLRARNLTPSQKYAALSGIADIDGLNAAEPESSVREWTEAFELAREQHSQEGEADALRGLGTTWLEAGSASRAEPLLRRALNLFDRDENAKPWAIAATLTTLGQCYRVDNKLALAEDAYNRALQLDTTTFGEQHPQVAYIMERLAEVYAERRAFEQARAYSDRALAVMRVSVGVNSPAMAAAFVNRASVEKRAGSLEAAADNYAAALRIAQSQPGNGVLERRIIERYTPLLKAIHRDREARELGLLAKSLAGAPVTGFHPQGTR